MTSYHTTYFWQFNINILHHLKNLLSKGKNIHVSETFKCILTIDSCNHITKGLLYSTVKTLPIFKIFTHRAKKGIRNYVYHTK